MMNLLFCVFALGGATTALAQSYSIDWYTVAGGGGASAGGAYAVAGTVGQATAAPPMTGGGFSITSGFWSAMSVVQTPGLPTLTITANGGQVVLSWVASGSYQLQQNANLAAPSAWTTNAAPVILNNGTNSVTIAPAPGSLFFRLHL